MPFSLELLALRRLTTAAFGTLMCLEPAIALIVGFTLLDQTPGLFPVIGLGFVVAAGIGAERSGARHREVDDENAGATPRQRHRLTPTRQLSRPDSPTLAPRDAHSCAATPRERRDGQATQGSPGPSLTRARPARTHDTRPPVRLTASTPWAWR